MDTFSNKLSDAEAERLALLLEELGEAQQAIGKILRHGYESSWKAPAWQNRRDLEKELGHVRFAMELMNTRGDISMDAVNDYWNLKNRGVWKFLHHQGTPEASPQQAVSKEGAQ